MILARLRDEVVEMAQHHIPARSAIGCATRIQVEGREVETNHAAALADHVKLPVGQVARTGARAHARLECEAAEPVRRRCGPRRRTPSRSGVTGSIRMPRSLQRRTRSQPFAVRPGPVSGERERPSAPRGRRSWACSRPGRATAGPCHGRGGARRDPGRSLRRPPCAWTPAMMPRLHGSSNLGHGAADAEVAWGPPVPSSAEARPWPARRVGPARASSRAASPAHRRCGQSS